MKSTLFILSAGNEAVFPPFSDTAYVLSATIMKQYAETFYKSKAWQSCRNAYMKSVGGLCEDCYKVGKIVPAEEVHHIKFITPQNISDPNVTLNWKNLVALCREHHRQRHGTRNRRYTVDEWGRVTPK